jgi:hypothetical protein
MASTRINSVAEFMTFVDSLPWISKERSHARAWFRGQGDARWKLTPGVYRPGFIEDDDEVARLKKERHLSQDFFVRSGNLLAGPRNDVDLYFLQQHFGMPTRLLDWTTSALVALYFAVWNKHDQKVDGAIAALDAYKFYDKSGIATSRRPEVIAAVKIITNWEKKEFPDRILVVRPTQIEMRMSLQRAGFTFHVPRRPVLEEADNSTLRVAIVSHSAKEMIRRQLLNLGVDAASIYGDLPGLAVALKDSHGVDR